MEWSGLAAGFQLLLPILGFADVCCAQVSESSESLDERDREILPSVIL